MTTTPAGLLAVSAIDRRCVAVGAHLLEVERDDEDVCGWTLRCRHCLAEVARSHVGRRPHLPGLPISAALAVGAGTEGVAGSDEPFTLALGRIAPDCEHPDLGRPDHDHPAGGSGRAGGMSRVPRPARTPARVEFRAGLVPGTGVRRADPLVMPGGWWVAAARGAARSVTSQAFGIRHRAWARTVELTACPEHPGPAGTRSPS